MAEELQRAKEALEAACSETEGRAALAQSAAAAATEAAEASALLAESGVRDAQLAAEEEKAEVRAPPTDAQPVQPATAHLSPQPPPTPMRGVRVVLLRGARVV